MAPTRDPRMIAMPEKYSRTVIVDAPSMWLMHPMLFVKPQDPGRNKGVFDQDSAAIPEDGPRSPSRRSPPIRLDSAALFALRIGGNQQDGQAPTPTQDRAKRADRTSPPCEAVR